MQTIGVSFIQGVFSMACLWMAWTSSDEDLKTADLVTSTENFKAHSRMFIYLCKEELHKENPLRHHLRKIFKVRLVFTVVIQLSEIWNPNEDKSAWATRNFFLISLWNVLKLFKALPWTLVVWRFGVSFFPRKCLSSDTWINNRCVKCGKHSHLILHVTDVQTTARSSENCGSHWSGGLVKFPLDSFLSKSYVFL